jgi:hypothetical protein
MNSEQDLMQRLMVSKKIMDKHNDIGRGQARDINMGGDGYSSPMVEDFQAPSAKYNLPQEFLQEQQMSTPKVNSNIPMEDRIASSKLPDEIKRLMMEHPIQQPTMGTATGSVLSDELVEKASRLMNTNAKGDVVRESKTTQRPQKQESLDMSGLKDLIRETMEDVLHENGLLVESESKSSDVFKFRVGQHIFEGKVTKIRKIAK